MSIYLTIWNPREVGAMHHLYFSERLLYLQLLQWITNRQTKIINTKSQVSDHCTRILIKPGVKLHTKMCLLVNLESNSLKTTYHLPNMNSHLQKYCFSFSKTKIWFLLAEIFLPTTFPDIIWHLLKFAHNFKTCTNINHQTKSPKNNSQFSKFLNHTLRRMFPWTPIKWLQV